MILSIQSAEYINEYKIKLLFSDNSQQTIDFSDFIFNSRNPMICKYIDIEKFKQFNIQYGDLVWNDYELCFPIIDLYNNVI